MSIICAKTRKRWLLWVRLAWNRFSHLALEDVHKMDDLLSNQVLYPIMARSEALQCTPRSNILRSITDQVCINLITSCDQCPHPWRRSNKRLALTMLDSTSHNLMINGAAGAKTDSHKEPRVVYDRGLPLRDGSGDRLECLYGSRIILVRDVEIFDVGPRNPTGEQPVAVMQMW